MGKHCSGVFFWIYAIFTVLLIFHSTSAIYEYNHNGETPKYYSSVGISILITIVLALACIHSRITYIFLIVVFGIIVILHIVGIVFYCIALAHIAAHADEKTSHENRETFTSAVILLCVQVLFALFQFSVLRLFYIAFKYHL